MASINTKKLRNSIKEILKDADLSALSAKKVRRQLEEEYDADFTHRKKEIDEILMELVEEAENGKKNGSPGETVSDDETEKPSSKKAKTTKTEHSDSSNDDDEEDKDDEEVARKLQEEEDSGGRRTRHTKKKKAPVKKKEKAEGGQKRLSIYSRPCQLSDALATVMGTDQLARKDIVKNMWAIVKERNLQDPDNRQWMICDEQLLKVFGRKRVRTFGMMKYLKDHISPL